MAKYTKEQLSAAVNEVFGTSRRNASGEALEKAFGNYRGSLDQLKHDWAATPEAQKRGVDAAKYGVEYVDYDALDDEGKSIYDAYRRGYGKNLQLTKTDLDNFRKNSSPELVEAQGKGLVTGRLENGRRTLEISAKAWKTYGSGLLKGLHKNEAVIIDGTGLDQAEVLAATKAVSRRWRPYTKGTEAGGDLEGKLVFTKDPKSHSGVLGSVAKSVGLSEGAANSLDRVVGQSALPVAAFATVTGLGGGGFALMDEAAAIGGGTRGVSEYGASVTRALGNLGLGQKSAEKAMGYGDVAGDIATAVAVTVATSGIGAAGSLASLGASTAGASAVTAVEGLQRSQVGEGDWEAVGRSLAADWITAGAGYGLGKLSNMAVTAGMAGTSAGLDTLRFAWGLGGKEVASKAIQGGNSEDLAWAAGKGFVLGVLPGGAAWQAPAGFVLDYADNQRRGMEDSDAFILASMNSAARVAEKAVFPGSSNSWSEHWAALSERGSDIIQQAKGKIPERRAFEEAVNAYNYYVGGTDVDHVPGSDPVADAFETKALSALQRYQEAAKLSGVPVKKDAGGQLLSRRAAYLNAKNARARLLYDPIGWRRVAEVPIGVPMLGSSHSALRRA